MRTLKVLVVVVCSVTVLALHTRAQTQSLPISLFERYLDLLRQQAGIPGLSAAIVQNGQLAWDRGFGYQEIEAFVSATGDTPYPLLDLTQTLSSTVLLQQCLELRYLDLSDRVRRWNSGFPEDSTTVAQLLAHAAAGGNFQYSAGRYAALTTVIDQCSSGRYSRLVTEEILNRLGMTNSVPSHDLADGTPIRREFTNNERERYGNILLRVAVPYKVEATGRASRSSYPRPSLSASTGVVSTVRDLARFDAALDDNILLDADTRRRAWDTTGSVPTGLGWFVQRYNGERVVWHFGLARDAYSALYVKVPDRRLTLILLANSDGLAAPYNLSNGDVTVSLFAQLFLKLFVP
ncbi:MAG: serine hydrolase domain-containing protein [Vicinamibacterales bacterium]